MENRGKQNFGGKRNEDGTKNRRRNHKTNTRKEQLKKAQEKRMKQLKIDRQISRNKRSEKRRTVFSVQKGQNCSNDIKIIFVIDETDNNEKVLLQRVNLDNGMYCLELPTITQDQVLENQGLGVRTIIKKEFGVDAETFIPLPDKRIIVVKNIKANESDLVSMVVRTYNESTWFNADVLTTVDAVPFYCGEDTDIYLASPNNLGNVVVSGNLLYKILDYRVSSGKIQSYKKFTSYGGTGLRMHGPTHYVWTLTNNEVMSKLEKEESEVQHLLFGDRVGKVHQDITKFIRFKPIFDKYSAKLVEEQEKFGCNSESEWLVWPSKTFNEYEKTARRYFDHKRK